MHLYMLQIFMWKDEGTHAQFAVLEDRVGTSYSNQRYDTDALWKLQILHNQFCCYPTIPNYIFSEMVTYDSVSLNCPDRQTN
ncbi:hypothetical protein SUGI_0747120 [Cryptomeria japonica]|nr:hypothetical protein SUGI_0747120 [Cryptomeria japonica]